MKTAYFGGSFNPIHIGHIQIVNALLLPGRMNKVTVMPAFQNPLKERLEIFEDSVRLAMIKACFAKNPKVEVSEMEMKEKIRSYTVNTLRNMPGKRHEKFFAMGMDAYSGFDQWKDPLEITEYCDLIVFNRFTPDKGKYPLPEIHSRISEKVHFYDDRINFVSSGQIREAIEKNDQVALFDMLPPEVLPFIFV